MLDLVFQSVLSRHEDVFGIYLDSRWKQIKSISFW